ncbi:hypothetical protein HHK36_010509 [Tetracentron sinense]|uniref:NAD-dependent epimerase/dehydratase domain-containing protein n=1 Tax=Tetracentron sinense TaxID=13715 RepID=A0A835DMF6_TETSI|nr:hypothetical protein HHK36_010509 [Tetracentron sinense]
MAEKGRVCVTGAGGYVASWLVKLLLSKGYMVHGTVRDPSDEKNAHLEKLEKAPENLELFKANLLDYDSLCAAITGCDGVFHVASPVPSSKLSNPEAIIPHSKSVELVEPAVKGTLNVLKACSEAKVKRVVVVSSGAAVSMNPNWPKDQVKDETCWSDKDYCRETKNWYSVAKTEAESGAFEYANRSELNVVSVCPTLVIGPMLQSTVNATSLVLIKLIKGGWEAFGSRARMIVDVRDVVEALLLAYEKSEAEGRYICASYLSTAQDLVEKLRTMYPSYNYPKKYSHTKMCNTLFPNLFVCVFFVCSFAEVEEEVKVSSEKLQRLGWRYRPLEETLADAVKNYQEAGVLDKN